MPAAAESSIKPDINDMLHHICIDDPGPHNQDIGVIMLTGSLRGKSIMAQGGPDTCKFVGGDAHADAGTADKYSPLSLAGLHSLGYSGAILGIMDAFFRITTFIFYLKAFCFQIFFDLFFCRKAGMITTDSDFNIISPLIQPFI